LNRLELSAVEFVRVDAVRRHLETVFEEGDPPAREDYFLERFAAEFQVVIPREGHEDIRYDEQ